jgi:hypothetical protein
MGEWIGSIDFPSEVADKIKQKHGITPEEVREAVSLGAAEELRWDHDEVHGRRLLAIGTPYHGAYRVIAVLAPVDRTDGSWRCKTAMRWTR